MRAVSDLTRVRLGDAGWTISNEKIEGKRKIAQVCSPPSPPPPPPLTPDHPPPPSPATHSPARPSRYHQPPTHPPAHRLRSQLRSYVSQIIAAFVILYLALVIWSATGTQQGWRARWAALAGREFDSAACICICGSTRSGIDAVRLRQCAGHPDLLPGRRDLQLVRLLLLLDAPARGRTVQARLLPPPRRRLHRLAPSCLSSSGVACNPHPWVWARPARCKLLLSALACWAMHALIRRPDTRLLQNRELIVTVIYETVSCAGFLLMMYLMRPSAPRSTSRSARPALHGGSWARSSVVDHATRVAALRNPTRPVRQLLAHDTLDD